MKLTKKQAMEFMEDNNCYNKTKITKKTIDIALKTQAKEHKEELMKWVYKNNTIPLKESGLRLCSTDGGWVNGLKLQKAINEIIK